MSRSRTPSSSRRLADNVLLLGMTSAFFAWIPTAAAEPAQSDSRPAAEKVDVDKIKERYWARGDESELGVVQNRLYSKERKFEFSLHGGIVTTDPFLSVKNFGGSVGYHFNEYLSAHFVAWKDFVEPSTALITFENTIGATTNNNRPDSYFGVEGSASVLYGKLSLVGKSIIYFDLHLTGGLGRTSTESGDYLTPSVGIGQQVYLSKSLSLKIDYRLMYYREQIVEKVIPTKLGQAVGERDNWTNSVTFGIGYLWDPIK